MGPSGPKRRRRSPTTLMCSSCSMTTRPSTGSICGPRTRVDLCDRAPTPTRDQRPRIEGRRDRDGIQTHRGCTSPLAGGQRAPPRATGPSRSHLHQRQTRRTRHRNCPKGGSRLKEPHPQVLTITLSLLYSAVSPLLGQLAVGGKPVSDEWKLLPDKLHLSGL